jgi:acetoacetyl-CoA synthetase
MTDSQPLWRPSPERVARAHITTFRAWLERERGLRFSDYEALWNWSVTDLEGFWSASAVSRHPCGATA